MTVSFLVSTVITTTCWLILIYLDCLCENVRFVNIIVRDGGYDEIWTIQTIMMMTMLMN